MIETLGGLVACFEAGVIVPSTTKYVSEPLRPTSRPVRDFDLADLLSFSDLTEKRLFVSFRDREDLFNLFVRWDFYDFLLFLDSNELDRDKVEARLLCLQFRLGYLSFELDLSLDWRLALCTSYVDRT